VNEYLENILPAPFTVLGKRLKPYSITRAILLHRFHCLPVADFEKLITAVVICSRPVANVLPTLADPRLNQKIKAWGKRLGKFDPLEKMLLFQKYIEAYSKRPNVFSEDSFLDGCGPGAPHLQHLRVTLLSRCNWTIHDVDEQPLSQAYWDYDTYWEIEDRVQIVDELEQDFERAMVATATEQHEERLRKTAHINFFENN
jgi:hypothetical protein